MDRLRNEGTTRWDTAYSPKQPDRPSPRPFHPSTPAEPSLDRNQVLKRRVARHGQIAKPLAKDTISHSQVPETRPHTSPRTAQAPLNPLVPSAVGRPSWQDERRAREHRIAQRLSLPRSGKSSQMSNCDRQLSWQMSRAVHFASARWRAIT